MRMAEIDIAPGIDDPDDGLALPVGGIEAALAQPRAMAECAQIVDAKPAPATELLCGFARHLVFLRKRIQSQTLKFIAGRTATPRTGNAQLRRACYSMLTLAVRTTFSHFNVSFLRKVPKSSGVPGAGMPPISFIRAWFLGSLSARLISLFRSSTISFGVPCVTPNPKNALAS